MGEVAEGGWGCGGILAGDVADRIVIIVLGIGATDGVQAVEFITFGLYALRYEIKVSEL